MHSARELKLASILRATGGPATTPTMHRRDTWQRFARRLLWTRKSSGLGAIVLLVLVVSAVAAPLISPTDPDALNLAARYQAPLSNSWMGTDNFGRDILSRTIWGGRVSLAVGVVAVAISILIGGSLGVVAGYAGGWSDQILSFVVETLMALPLLLLALTIIAVLGPGLFNVMLAIGLGSAPMFARVLRAGTQVARRKDYTMAARTIGASHSRIIIRHILPNIMASLVVVATTRIAGAILAESSLSFLGLGIRPPTATWGTMVADGRGFMERAPWIPLEPGAVIMLAVLSFNLVGDGWRDALDARLRHSDN